MSSVLIPAAICDHCASNDTYVFLFDLWRVRVRVILLPAGVGTQRLAGQSPAHQAD